MKSYTPAEYALEMYHGKVTDKTVRNWIKRGKLPKGTTCQTTPTGHYILLVEETKSNVDILLEQMKMKAA